MQRATIAVNEILVPVIVLDVAVVGSGCAGFNAADWLHKLGRRNIAIVTEGVNQGTSRNTGSDKQTYYKLSLIGSAPDSVRDMASDIFAGGGINGDIALCEAAGSVRGFMKLSNLGVPFPANEFGEYAGYKTDHDPRSRATSAGPLTSRYMTEHLEQAVLEKGVAILDNLTVIQLLVSDDGVEGLVCLDKTQLESLSHGLTVIRARQVVLATGGPAISYHRSVYPESQTGMSGLAFEAGATGANLQEWQYGLASLKFRWNVSGTYQQVLPRYISIDSQGVEREFLLEHLGDANRVLDLTFLKGYQWPFDAAKIEGSSLIDILVHNEITTLERRVYLDYRQNPTGLENGFDNLSNETRQYLLNSGATQGTPIERLRHMNEPAINLYKNNGIDLDTEPLEIGVCAQHHNGGIDVDAHWQTNIRGLYTVGEAAGTFGARRPGGSALNSTQVGSYRATEHIACSTKAEADCPDKFMELAIQETGNVLDNLKLSMKGTPSNVKKQREHFSCRMSDIAGHLRTLTEMAKLEEAIREELNHFFQQASAQPEELPALMKNRDMLITQAAILSAMQATAESVGSRGGYLVIKEDGVVVPGCPSVCYQPQHENLENLRTITSWADNSAVTHFEKVRPMPDPDTWFETVWNQYQRRMAAVEENK